MERIAQFEKVSLYQFGTDFMKAFPAVSDIKSVYENIKLPERATSGSAGYDFYAPVDFTLEQGKSLLIPTGIRAKINDGWVLNIFPRSGLGFKHRVQLDNTVGIIDADYYNSSNEGHIMIKLSCDAHDAGHSVSIKAGEGFAQGIFLQFGITFDDESNGVRDGGFGSTTK
jgi:dUTP pyrophosphatase